MGTLRCKIVHYHFGPTPLSGSLLSLEDLSRLSQVHPDMIERLLEWQLVEPVKTQPERLFPESVVPRIRRIMRLRKDLGINWAGIGVVLELLDRIDTLEQENARLRKQGRPP